MKKILNEWRRYLNEFKMDDKYQDIDAVVDTNVDAQSIIQAEIDKQMKMNIGGRPINPIFLSNSIQEQSIPEFLDRVSDYKDGEKILDGLVEVPITVNLSAHMDTLRQIDRGTATIYAPQLNAFMEEGADYVRNYDKIVATVDHNMRVMQDFYQWLINSSYLRIMKALALYTGHNVESIRNPSNFDPEKSMKSIFDKDFFLVSDRSGVKENHFNVQKLNKKYKFITEWLLPTFDFHFSDTRENLESIASLKNYKKFIKQQILGGSTLGPALEEFRSSEEFKKRYNFYMIFITRWKPILDKMRKFSYIEPTQEDYQESKSIIQAMCTAPDKGREIYRGMTLDVNAISELIGVNPLKLEDYMAAGEIVDFDTVKPFIFDFGVVSSCSTDYDVAYDFAMPFRNSSEKEGVMFRGDAKRGVYLGSYSAYPEEDEFLTSGRMKITKVTLRPGKPKSIFDFYCEQV